MPNPFDDASIDTAVNESGVNVPQEVPVKLPTQNMPKGLFAAMMGAGAADGLTTAMNLSGGAHETNPLLSQNKILNPIETIGTNLGVALLAKHLYHNHPTIAKILGGAATGLGYVDALSNLTNRPVKK